MRKVIGVLLFISIVFPLLLSGMVLFSVLNWGLERDTFTDILTTESFHTLVYSDAVMENLLENSGQAMQGIALEDFQDAFQTLVSPQILDEQVSTIVDDVFDFLERKSDVLALEIDLTPLKARFRGAQQDEMLAALATALPVCDAEQLLRSKVELCKPDFISEEDFVEEFLRPNLPLILGLIPDSIDLNDPIRYSSLVEDVPVFWRQILLTWDLYDVIYLFIGAVLFLWFITAFIAGKNWRERLLWMGWMLLIPAVLVLVSGFFFDPLLVWNWTQYGLTQTGGGNWNTLPTHVQEAFKTFMLDLNLHLRNGFMMVGGFCTAIGISLIAWGAATRYPMKKEEA